MVEAPPQPLNWPVGYRPAKARIQRLDPNLINRIAAGEVIERPASVVKECVENSLDAGSTDITVDIDDGGRELIRITDNGQGIHPADLALAFAPHATSKIAFDDDLFAIRTLGFRGEALASIGSVSHARLISRPRSELAGLAVDNVGGEISPASANNAVGMNFGTVVEIRHLFFNVPARRRFLKSAATETGHVADTLLRVALPRPDVSFKLVVNGKVHLHLPAVADPVSRWLEAWPDHFRERFLKLDRRERDVQLFGIVGLPELAAVTSRHQHLFVNGRPIRDKSLTHAVRESFRGLTEPGRFPAAILLIQLPPADVDVNVHPTKSEVRFRDASRLHGLTMASIRELLLANNLAPLPTLRPADSRQVDLGSISVGFDRQTAREQVAEFLRQPPPPDTDQRPSPFFGGMRLPQTPPAAALPGTTETKTEVVGTGPIAKESACASAIQLHNSYLVAQTPEGLVIIDQHALHERILFEELMTLVKAGQLESQRLLLPVTLRVSTRQVALLDSLAPLMKQLGIDAHPIGPDAVAIDAFPSFLEKLDIGDFFLSMLDLADAEDARLTSEQLLHNVLDMMACKAAVKAGDPLAPQEISALLARSDLVDRASNCPHGRPTMLRMTLRDLEKQFKRTGF